MQNADYADNSVTTSDRSQRARQSRMASFRHGIDKRLNLIDQLVLTAQSDCALETVEDDSSEFYDELFQAPGCPRPEARQLIETICSMPAGELGRRQAHIERSLLRMGITFNVYGEESGTERIWPFDIIPRIVAASEWIRIESGLKQRIQALNMFIHDIYHKQEIVRDSIIPAELIKSAVSFREVCCGITPPRGIWCHITGTDLVRDNDGQIFVLEDNLRCPSGVSYVLQNRMLMKRSFPQIFETSSVRPIDDYASRLLETLQYLAPEDVQDPTVVVLTPGIYNSAYYEHSFLAQQMGVVLVEGRDLVVRDGFVYMRTTSGFQRVDVIYRRIDDDYLDPAVSNKSSVLGVSS